MGRLTQTSLATWLGLLLSASTIVSAGSIASGQARSQLSSLEEEQHWSRRFLEAKTRLRELREEHDRLSSKLNALRNFWCGSGDGAKPYMNPYLVSKTGAQLERVRKELEAAEQALADLQESLRRSGKPVAWQESRLAIEKPEQAASNAIPVVKDKEYWHKQLSTIDKRYDYLIEPLRIELFELVYRRAPNPGEDITVTGPTCTPFYSKLQQRIKELRQQHQEQRAALMEQSRREGALPGWFR